MTLYRKNPILPPVSRDKKTALAELIIEAAISRIREDIGEVQFVRALAEHWLDQGSSTWISNRVADLALDLIEMLDPSMPVASLGSGRKQAKDGGGRIVHAIDQYVEALLAALPKRAAPAEISENSVWVLTHTSSLPLSPKKRQAWFLTRPKIAKALQEIMFSMLIDRPSYDLKQSLVDAVDEFEFYGVESEPSDDPYQEPTITEAVFDEEVDRTPQPMSYFSEPVEKVDRIPWKDRDPIDQSEDKVEDQEPWW
jgi:hypothetical protein